MTPVWLLYDHHMTLCATYMIAWEALAASWEHLGSLLRALKRLLGRLGASCEALRDSWERFQSLLKRLKSVLGASWSVLGASWEALGSILEGFCINFQAQKRLGEHVGQQFHGIVKNIGKRYKVFHKSVFGASENHENFDLKGKLA